MPNHSEFIMTFYKIVSKLVTMRILGIDPGLATVGFGVVEVNKNKLTVLGYGAITTPPSMAFHDRLLTISKNMMSLLASYDPTQCAVESLFFTKNVSTGIQVAHARGVIMCALASHNIEPASYPPTAIKQAITGYGGSEKKQMQYMVKETLRLPSVPTPDDVADALAVAICHYYMHPIKSLA